MWKYYENEFAYQTDDKAIANNLKRRGFCLFNYGLNCDHWVYHTRKRCERDALSTLKALTKKEPKYNSKSDVWECS